MAIPAGRPVGICNNAGYCTEGEPTASPLHGKSEFSTSLSKLEVIFCAVGMAENNFVNALILFIRAKEYSDLKHHQLVQMMCEEDRSLAW